MSALGNDFFSHFVKHFLNDEGIDTRLITHLDRPMRRVTAALSYPKDRALVTYIDESPKTVDLALEAMYCATFKHLHFPRSQVYVPLSAPLDRCPPARI